MPPSPDSAISEPQIPHPSEIERVASAAERLIRAVVAEAPRRHAGSSAERRAQQLLRERIAPWVDSARLWPFRFNTNLYFVIAAHFALGTAGSVVLFWSPLAALLLHFGAAVSYLLDSTRRAYLLRRLFPWRSSQNLLAVQRATDPLRRRIVLIAHADAAPAGLLFHEALSKGGGTAMPRVLRVFRKPLQWGVIGLLVLAAGDLWLIARPEGRLPIINFVIFTSLAAVITLLNVQAGFSRTTAGANDNLSGCAAVVLLAERLGAIKPADVELVYVITGAEEAGTGGAYALARRMRHRWDREATDVVCLDALTGGELCVMHDGEVLMQPLDESLVAAARRAASLVPGQGRIEIAYPAAGASDLTPFQRFGFRGIAFGCFDPRLGVPRHYHRLSDTPENLEPIQLGRSILVAEHLCRELMRAA